MEPDYLSEDSQTAYRAIRALKDQDALFDAANHARDIDDQMLAAAALTAQDKLTAIAMRHPHGGICRYAAERLENTDLAQTIYADIARYDADEYFRVKAAECLTDTVLAQATYAAIARDGADEDARLLVADNLADTELAQVTYAAIARDGIDENVRYDAAIRLEDVDLAQAAYAAIARHGVDEVVRFGAAEMLEDTALAQEIYADIARRGAIVYYRFMAALWLDDTDTALAQETFADIAKNARDHTTRKVAVMALTDVDYLRVLANSTNDDDVRTPEEGSEDPGSEDFYSENTRRFMARLLRGASMLSLRDTAKVRLAELQSEA